MRTKLLLIITLFYLINCNSTNAQYGDNEFALSLSVNYTTTSKLYLSPNAADPVIRGEYTSLNDVYHYGAEIRYRVYEPLILGLNIEYYKRTGAITEVIGIRRLSSYPVDADDGFTLIPVELSAYYLLPFSSDKFKFLMGGGIGIYFGSHLRSLHEIDVSNEERKFAYGIHVQLGIEYLVYDFLSVTGGMKFRDPEFEMTTRYNEEVFVEEGEEVLLRDDTFDSKVNIDGVTFYLGVSFGFSLFD